MSDDYKTSLDTIIERAEHQLTRWEFDPKGTCEYLLDAIREIRDLLTCRPAPGATGPTGGTT